MQVVKTYSPNLMVHPLLPSSETVGNPNSIDAPALASPIIAMLSRLHALVIGPGLGRDGVTKLGDYIRLLLGPAVLVLRLSRGLR